MLTCYAKPKRQECHNRISKNFVGHASMSEAHMARFTIQAGIAKIDEASVIKVHQNGPSQTALRKDEGWVTPIMVRLDCRIEFFHVGWRILEIYCTIDSYSSFQAHGRFPTSQRSPRRRSGSRGRPGQLIIWLSTLFHLVIYGIRTQANLSRSWNKLNILKSFGMREYAQCQAWPPQCNLEAKPFFTLKNPAALENSGLPWRTQRSAKQW